jgi:hypothetical protein
MVLTDLSRESDKAAFEFPKTGPKTGLPKMGRTRMRQDPPVMRSITGYLRQTQCAHECRRANLGGEEQKKTREGTNRSPAREWTAPPWRETYDVLRQMSGSEKHWNRPKWLSTSPSHNLEHQLFVIKKAWKAKPTPPHLQARLQCDRSAAWLGLARRLQSKLTIWPCTSARQALLN